ncbi:hypothetical protein DMP23_21055 [Amycolatopsis sp. A1MSW2902]|uniref:hypothetical protein n=1 Tax=Amycolatopsis sp. A1MSW2902 TaxID=687413 RepID=UPI00307DC966
MKYANSIEIASAWPKPPKPPPNRGSRLDPYRPVIDRWLHDDLDAPRKQPPSAKRIFDRLCSACTPLSFFGVIGVGSRSVTRNSVTQAPLMLINNRFWHIAFLEVSTREM